VPLQKHEWRNRDVWNPVVYCYDNKVPKEMSTPLNSEVRIIFVVSVIGLCFYVVDVSDIIFASMGTKIIIAIATVFMKTLMKNLKWTDSFL